VELPGMVSDFVKVSPFLTTKSGSHKPHPLLANRLTGTK